MSLLLFFVGAGILRPQRRSTLLVPPKKNEDVQERRWTLLLQNTKNTIAADVDSKWIGRGGGHQFVACLTALI